MSDRFKQREGESGNVHGEHSKGSTLSLVLLGKGWASGVTRVEGVYTVQ
jgi:hypothetical protein